MQTSTRRSATSQANASSRRALSDPSEHIHLALYCFKTPRVLPQELELIRKLAVDVPVLAVITQCLGRRDAQAEEPAATLRAAALPLARPVVFKILAREVEIDEGVVIAPFGLPELVRVMAELLPAAARSAFVASQRLVLDVKTAAAKKIVIAAAAAGAGAIGVSPIPISVDTPGIAAVQFAMINRVSVIMVGLPNTGRHAALEDVRASSGILTSMIVGRTIARGLTSVDPDCRERHRRCSSASKATYTLGMQYMKMCAALLERFLFRRCSSRGSAEGAPERCWIDATPTE